MPRVVCDRSVDRVPIDERPDLLTESPEEYFPLVREPIADSWLRSQKLGVSPNEIEPREAITSASTQNDAVLKCVDDVFSRFAERLANEPVTIIFATPDGSVARRFCGDTELARQLDSVYLLPGSGYDEQTVGTNGIGTATETGKPTLVHGDEHYNEKLSVFTCAGQPIFHPLTGSLVGVVDVTCYAEYASSLLMTSASTLAVQIEQELFDTVSGGESQLLREYLGACRHTSNPVIAQGDEVVMMNRHAQQLLTPEDRASLLIHSADFTGASNQESVVADFPSGLSALLSYRPSTLNGRVVGGIVRVRLGETDSPVRGATISAGRIRPLAGLVGSSPEWLRASEIVLRNARQGKSLVVAGETSIGKASLARAAHFRVNPTHRFAVLDCENVPDIDAFVEELASELEGEGTLLLREIDRLPGDAISAVSELLVEHRSSPPDVGPTWIVATRTVGSDDSEVDCALLPNFDVSVSVPPLRHRPDDIASLAVGLLQSLDRENRVRFDDAALRHLSRLPWYGNMSQLWSVVRECIRDKRTGSIGIDDLPAECDSAVRRSLTPFEAVQRDSIVDALRVHDGRKSAAAEHLGISRATIYRKIREFGIEVRKSQP